MKNRMKDWHVYPAIFEYEEGQEIAVLFPDLNTATSGVDEKDALNSARELLGLVLYGFEKDDEAIPTPSKLKDLKCKSNQKAVLVDVCMPLVRNEVVNLTLRNR